MQFIAATQGIRYEVLAAREQGARPARTKVSEQSEEPSQSGGLFVLRKEDV